MTLHFNTNPVIYVNESTYKERGWLQVEGLNITPHGKEVDNLAFEEGRFRQFDEKELAEREIIVVEGLLAYGLQKKNLTVIKNPMIWVMHPDGKIFADYSKDGSIFHTSLTARKKPIAAGEITALNGNISMINEKSGHFMQGQVRRIDILIKELKYQGYNKEIPVQPISPAKRPEQPRKSLQVNLPAQVAPIKVTPAPIQFLNEPIMLPSHDVANAISSKSTKCDCCAIQ